MIEFEVDIDSLTQDMKCIFTSFPIMSKFLDEETNQGRGWKTNHWKHRNHSPDQTCKNQFCYPDSCTTNKETKTS